MPIGDYVHPVPAPGEDADSLEELLGIDSQPKVQARLEKDLAAVRDAERRADSNTEGVRLHRC